MMSVISETISERVFFFLGKLTSLSAFRVSASVNVYKNAVLSDIGSAI
jgi:hypothetical protein